MEKKKMTNKKKFWIGMSSLAAIGVITATVAYFWSTHTFDSDTIKSLGYSVYATKVLDTTAAKNMISGQTLDADVKVANKGATPILARITYTWKDGSETYKDGKAIKIDGEDASLKDLGFTFTLDKDSGSEFEYADGVYYYKGKIETSGEGDTHAPNECTHLKSITYNDVVGTEGDDHEGTLTDPAKTPDGESIANSKQITYTVDGASGELTVKVETIQATKSDGTELNGNDLTTAVKVANAWGTLTGKTEPGMANQ